MGKVPGNENEETLRAFPSVVLLGQLEVHEDMDKKKDHLRLKKGN